MAEIAITYDARTTVPLDTVTDFQGDAKQITQDNLDKLKRSILKHGFFVPMFVWKKSASSKTYIIDGHQRLKALMSLRDDDGHTVPDIPVEFIIAKSKKDAAEKLLAISSQFGDFDFNGLREFGELVHLDIAALEDIRLVYNEFALTMPEENMVEESDNQPEIVICPHCGAEIDLPIKKGGTNGADD